MLFEYFNLSYLVLWVLVCLLTYSNIQLVQKVQALGIKRTPNPNHLPLNDQGISSGDLFPELTLVDKELGNWNSVSTEGSIVLITSFMCSSCKIVYPLIEPFLKKHPAINFLLLLDGDQNDLESVRFNYNLTVPMSTITDEMREPLKIRAFPFGYFLSPEGKVVAKGVVGHESGLDVLFRNGHETHLITENMKSTISA